VLLQIFGGLTFAGTGATFNQASVGAALDAINTAGPPYGRMLASGSQDATVLLWNLRK
jgi:hypothetical protein